MGKHIFVNHAPGAPGLRLFGLGPSFVPQKGIKKLQRLFNQNTLWAKGRSQKDIKKMLSKSSIIVSVWEYQKLIGFGRATTDQIYRATLWDIVVDECYQSLGIGEKIIQSILENSFIANVERVYLMTTFGEIFYSKIGFKKEEKQTLMKVIRK
ncbi:GNAT family N-acetyltransferase [Prochlorococcus sp. MIT 0916]|uniref:Putative acetyltransferase n=1 Tax=Prochlorococcus marinus str. P0903-H212 TaxID=1622208 RepID=A0A0D5A447_PROMR|nr:putative acetyltransferase [Prochlorococcus marinus str. P0903-H212]